jgi:MYXO-CTERM domain-containing protein
MKRALLVVALLAFAPSAIALACSCMRSTPAEALERSTAVFEGRVLEVTPFEERRDLTLEGGCLDDACRESLSETTESVEVSGFSVRFSVTRGWKGVSTEEVVVRTARDSAACGFAFEVGQDYVVYASAEDEAGSLSTGLCDRTARVVDANEDLEALGTGEVPVDVDGEPAATTDEPPARGGCASCAASGASAPAGAVLPVAFALTLLRRRRR